VRNSLFVLRSRARFFVLGFFDAGFEMISRVYPKFTMCTLYVSTFFIYSHKLMKHLTLTSSVFIPFVFVNRFNYFGPIQLSDWAFSSFGLSYNQFKNQTRSISPHRKITCYITIRKQDEYTRDSHLYTPLLHIIMSK